MIVAMTKYSFVLLKQDKDSFFEQLQELGVVDITRSTKPIDEKSSAIVAEIDAIKYEIKCIKETSNPEIKSLLEQRKSLKTSYDEIKTWGDYDIAKLSAFGVHYYQVGIKQFDPAWEQEYALQIVEQTASICSFVIIGSNEGFALKELNAPTCTASELEEKIAEVDAKVAALKSELEAACTQIPALEIKIAGLQSELSLYLAQQKGTSAAEDSIVIYEGFAPSEDDARLAEAFDQMSIYWLAEKAQVSDNPPIKLRNKAFVKQFEPLTKMYGMPVYNEFDPSVFLSIFFLLFFAICMGDAGYGLLLIIVGLVLKGKKGGLADMWGLVVTLGAGTIVMGLVMGGFFGVALNEQTWIPQGVRDLMITGDITVGGSTYAKQMVMALGIGVLHLCLAMVVKLVWSIKRFGFKHSLGAFGWTLLIVGGVIGLAIGLTGLISETAMKLLLIGIAAVSALGIYFFNHWGKNPLKNLGSGLWDTYNMASGLMGDLLSYIRLYALALSGGMLAATFNQIADMVKGTDPTWQWLPYILILVLGHAINLAMSCLGAFVHPLRLNFVEFFKNSGYEGRGSEYNPIKK